jgi:beta-galactosidase
MIPYLSLRWKVPYAPGTLSARGYKAGKAVADAAVETTGEPAALLLTPDRPAVRADGEDASVFTVPVVDAAGRVVPVAGNSVAFSVAGPGHILGVGNGDPSCHEPDKVVPASASREISVDGWRWRKMTDSYADKMPEMGDAFDDSGWDPIDVRPDAGVLPNGERAIYRVHFTVARANLAAPVAELHFGRIEGGEGIYVNGVKVPGSIDPRSPTVLDVRRLLRAGDNVVAVATRDWEAKPGGLSRGVSLVFQDAPGSVEWRRSAFNGLAEVIVQASKEPGAITLTARSDGLKPATFALESRPSAPRPAVP